MYNNKNVHNEASAAQTYRDGLLLPCRVWTHYMQCYKVLGTAVWCCVVRGSAMLAACLLTRNVKSIYRATHIDILNRLCAGMVGLVIYEIWETFLLDGNETNSVLYICICYVHMNILRTAEQPEILYTGHPCTVRSLCSTPLYIGCHLTQR